MLAVGVILMGVSALFAVASSLSVPPPINVPVVTKYITTEVQTVDQDETIDLTGNLCAQAKGKSLNVSVLLNNNPDWDPTYGVLRYYVVDGPSKTAADALCINVVGGVVRPNCVVKAWPSASDLYIRGTAGQSAAISFTLDADFFSITSDEAAYIQAHAPLHKKSDLKEFYGLRAKAAPVTLTQIITISTAQPLSYHKAALLNFTFCPTPKTGSRYEVRCTVTGTDGQSSYALYICDKLPCVVDGANIIAHNGRQLPSNVATTASGQWKTLYALVICWGGVYDKATDTYIGHFLFNAEQV